MINLKPLMQECLIRERDTIIDFILQQPPASYKVGCSIY